MTHVGNERAGADPGPGQARPPASCDVAVVGGGIIGVSTGLALARRGLRVAVFEKATVGCEQSSRNWGWIRTLSRDPAEVPLATRAKALWREIQARVDVGLRQQGMVYLAREPREMEAYARWLATVGEHAPDARLIDAAEASARVPSGPRRWVGGMLSDSDGVAEPGAATAGIARLAREAGCSVHEHCAVRGLDVAAGRVSGIVTEHGRVAANAVVLAGGAWSRLLCGNSGIAFPQLKVLGSVLRTTPVDAGALSAINGGDFTCRKRLDGGYTVSQFNASIADIVPDSFRLLGKFLPVWLRNNGLVKLRFGRRFFEELAVPRRFALDAPTPFERLRVLDPAPRPGAVADAFARLARAFPVFADARVAGAWAGYIDVTPDALPVISAVERLPGFFLASGFSGHGFGIGPAVGEAVADLVQGEQPAIDLRPFRFERFA